MTIIVSNTDRSWSQTRRMWFHRYAGCEFHVLQVHGSKSPVYEVDVSHLAARGEIDFTEAFVPAAYAEIAPAHFASPADAFATIPAHHHP